MTEFIAQCRYDEGQRLRAYASDASVILAGYDEGERVTEPYLSPADARTFARGILALADEVDGGEVKKAAPAAVKVGDKVRVTADDPDYRTGNYVGATGTLLRTDGDPRTPFRVQLDEPWASDLRTTAWWCGGVEALTEESPADEPAPSPRAAYLAEAQKLVGSRDVPQLLAVARFLAGESA